MVSTKDKERYEKIEAHVDCGTLTWRYYTEGRRETSMSHDEDVSEWTDQQIVDLTCDMLNVEKDQRILIEVIREYIRYRYKAPEAEEGE